MPIMLTQTVAMFLMMAVIVAVQAVVIWTYCAFVITRDRTVLDARRIASNPAVAAAAGFLPFLLSAVPSGVPGALLDGVAGMNTGLAMIVLGTCLAQSEFGPLIRDARIYKAAALRLVAMTALLSMATMPLALLAGLLAF